MGQDMKKFARLRSQAGSVKFGRYSKFFVSYSTNLMAILLEIGTDIDLVLLLLHS